jgi:hypothetical protein
MEAAEIVRRRAPGSGPRDRCLPLGIPAAGLVSERNKMVQSPKATVILYESDGTHRQIYTGGRTLPNEFEQPSWLGSSAGKWEGDTLVETAGFNDKTWLDLSGHPHSEALHIVERDRPGILGTWRWESPSTRIAPTGQAMNSQIKFRRLLWKH